MQHSGAIKPDEGCSQGSPVHRRTYIAQQKIDQHGDAPSGPRCEGRGDHHAEACRKRFDDIDAAEVEAAARVGPALAVDVLPLSEAPVAGPPAAPLEDAAMMVDSNITLQPKDPNGDVSMEANTGCVSSSHQPMSDPASATSMSVEPSTGTTRHAFDHLGEPAKHPRSAGTRISFEVG